MCVDNPKNPNTLGNPSVLLNQQKLFWKSSQFKSGNTDTKYIYQYFVSRNLGKQIRQRVKGITPEQPHLGGVQPTSPSFRSVSLLADFRCTKLAQTFQGPWADVEIFKIKMASSKKQIYGANLFFKHH